MKNKHIFDILSRSIINKMMKDKAVRVAITTESFLYFFHFYYAHYVGYKTADFQKEIFHLLEKSNTENLYIVAFRGSGKSTLVTTAYPIWAILGKQKKKFCVIFCQTRTQAKQHMMNIKKELENDNLLKSDLGPFQEESDEWGSYSLVFKKHGARITVASTEQSIRGIRHNEYRPDLIICDDVEDVQSAKTRDGRDKTYNWLRGEVIPCGDINTRLIIIGNLLHEDSLLMRIQDEVNNNKTRGVFKQYPLLNDRGECLWAGKYPDEESIENERLKVASEVSWYREYLLKIISTDGQIVCPEWIQFYDKFPTTGLHSICIGIDLAVSERDSADCTAMLVGYVYGIGKNMKVYLKENPINERISFPVQAEYVKALVATEKLIHYRVKLFVEDVGYQKAFIQLFESKNYDIEGVPTGRNDKATRLRMTTPFIKEGRVLFPKSGCEELIQQLLGFGKEKHDDLADSFSILVLKVIETNPSGGGILFG